MLSQGLRYQLDFKGAWNNHSKMGSFHPRLEQTTSSETHFGVDWKIFEDKPVGDGNHEVLGMGSLHNYMYQELSRHTSSYKG
jgi:hypothetical protein